MKKMQLLLVLVLLTWTTGIFAQGDMKETIGMIKTNLANSKQQIKKYAWIETTTTYIKGELKNTKQNQCYYSMDGKLTKVVTGATDQAKTPGGIRGKIVANKKEDMADYISKAMDKIQAYLPPDGEKLQQIYAGGTMAVQILDPGKKFKLSFPNYLQKGDLLSISLDKANQKLMAVSVNTYIDDPSQAVTFDVTYNNLPDGTQFIATTTLVAQAKELKIVVENSGYRLGAGQ